MGIVYSLVIALMWWVTPVRQLVILHVGRVVCASLQVELLEAAGRVREDASRRVCGVLRQGRVRRKVSGRRRLLLLCERSLRRGLLPAQDEEEDEHAGDA